MGIRMRAAISDDPLTYSVGATVNGQPWSPTDGVTQVRGAYLASPLARPEESDWVPGEFDRTPIGTVRALVPTGPGTVNDLAPGEWYEWVNVIDPATNSSPVMLVGSVIVR